MEAGCCPWLSKMTRARGRGRGMVPWLMEGPGAGGPGREEAAADGDEAVGTAAAAKEEAETAKRRSGCGHDRGGSCGRGMGDAAEMGDVTVGG